MTNILDDLKARAQSAWDNRLRLPLDEALRVTHQLANCPTQNGAAYVWHRMVDGTGEWVVSRYLPHRAEHIQKYFRVSKDGRIDACAGTLRQRVGTIRGHLIELADVDVR